MKSTELRVVPFHGDEIVTFEAGGVRYVAMRRIVENMGLDWARQSVKLAASDAKFNCCHMPTVGADGKERDMLAMPVEKLPLWLAGINPNKIKRADVRAKVERYQSESAIALHDYWTKGVAVRGDMDGILTAISPSAAKVIGGIVKGILHKELASLTRQEVERVMLADPRRAALNVVSVRQLLDDAKAIRKGRRSLNRRVGNALRDLAAANQDGGKATRCPHTGVWLFDRAFAEHYMRDGGTALVTAHNDKVRGQGVLKFARPVKGSAT